MDYLCGCCFLFLMIIAGLFAVMSAITYQVANQMDGKAGFKLLGLVSKIFFGR